jgi:hypothetical protein
MAPLALLVGKGLETIGAFALVYVGWKVARFEWRVNKPLQRRVPSGDSGLESLESVREMLLKLAEDKRKEFGPTEALFILMGTLLVAGGCLLYLVGLWQES